jgi:hypothetical protein
VLFHQSNTGLHELFYIPYYTKRPCNKHTRFLLYSTDTDNNYQS